MRHAHGVTVDVARGGSVSCALALGARPPYDSGELHCESIGLVTAAAVPAAYLGGKPNRFVVEDFDAFPS